ncbi:hypothetical protein KAR91_20770 [Candidatus Pacearchaeota archaeon]|nr:hypothetical protein [Candidatus Pacearchaeota archaeon]
MGLWKIINGRWGDGEGETDEVRIDGVTNALATVSYPHKEIHDGHSFVAHVDNITANSDDDRTLVGFETPAGTKWAHLIIFASSSEPAEVFLYEDVTIDDDEGTEKTIRNRNRNKGNGSTMLSFENPAVAGSFTWMTEAQLAAANFSAAIELIHFQLVAGAGPKALGGETRDTQEWVLAPATKYAVVIQNVGASINLHDIHLSWYEHTGKH